MEIHITITGVKQTQKNLQRLGGSLVKLSPAMQTIGKSLATYYGGVAFQSKGSAFGQRWAPLSAATKQEKAKHWRGEPDMVRTSSMRNSFSYKFNDTSAVIGNDAPYFKYHQSTEEPRNKMPRRVMIGINASVNNLVNTVISNHINKVLKDY